MTRETKIGLLVGLAFIIVIGVLLADYSAQNTRPPQAAMTGAADDVRNSARVPGARAEGYGPLTIPSVVPAPSLDNPARNEDQRANVTVGHANSGRARSIETTDEPRRPIREDDPRSSADPGNTGPITTITPDHGERGPLIDPPPTPQNNDATNPPADGSREIKAESGDTVSRWAQKYLGANTKANRDLIIAANPALKSHPNKVEPNKTYIIPAVKKPVPPAAETVVDRTPGATPPAPAPRTESTVSYTTRPGDSLWKIAVEQCGSGSLVSRIRELNRDTLKGSDAVKPNMTLKLPPKQLASAR